MAGKSAVLGAALGAAFSAAAVAAPYTQSTPPEEHAARIAGQQGDTLLSPTRFPARVIASEPSRRSMLRCKRALHLLTGLKISSFPLWTTREMAAA